MKHFLPFSPKLCLSSYGPWAAMLLALSGLATTADAQTLFGTATQYNSSGNGPVEVATGDFNGDGRPDLVLANYSSSSVGVLLAQPAPAAAGTFAATAATYALPSGANPYGVAVGDLNNDGRPDIVVANSTSNNISVLLNSATAPGTFPATATSYNTGGSFIIGVALADFDGDGRLDIVSNNYNQSLISVLLNSAATPGTFPNARTYGSGGNQPACVAVGDFNADGRPDIVTSNNSSGSIGVLLNSATIPGTFPATATAYSTGGTGPDGVAVSDMNGDGRPDIAVVNGNNGSTNGSIAIFFNSAAAPGTFPATAITYPSGGASSRRLALGDFNADGRPDLAVSNQGTSFVTVLLNAAAPAAAGTYAAAVPYATGGSGTFGVAVRDMNNDQRPDIVATNYISSTVSVLLNQSTAPLATAPALAAAGVALYPNPAHEAFTVSLPGLASSMLVEADLFNALGQVVLHSSATPAVGRSLTLQTAGLPAGVYQLRLQADATTCFKRMVIQ